MYVPSESVMSFSARRTIPTARMICQYVELDTCLLEYLTDVDAREAVRFFDEAVELVHFV